MEFEHAFLFQASDPKEGDGPRLMHRVRLDGDDDTSNMDCKSVWDESSAASKSKL